jgi:hypothetical protein
MTLTLDQALVILHRFNNGRFDPMTLPEREVLHFIFRAFPSTKVTYLGLWEAIS